MTYPFWLQNKIRKQQNEIEELKQPIDKILEKEREIIKERIRKSIEKELESEMVKGWIKNLEDDTKKNWQINELPELRKKLKESFVVDLTIMPTNELGVIVLFSMLSSKLGYKIKSINAKFPDGMILKDGTEKSVEFEYMASNFIRHKHDLSKVDYIICWNNDTNLPKEKIIELKETLKSIILM